MSRRTLQLTFDLVVAGSAVVFASCQLMGVGASTLPAEPSPSCAGIAIPRATLHGDSETGFLWVDADVEQQVDTRRFNLILPGGYSARYTPTLELFGDGGRLVASEGDVLLDVDACLEGDGRVLIVSIGRVTPGNQ